MVRGRGHLRVCYDARLSSATVPSLNASTKARQTSVALGRCSAN